MATKKNTISLLAGSVAGIMTGTYLNLKEKNNLSSKFVFSEKSKKNTLITEEFHCFI